VNQLYDKMERKLEIKLQLYHDLLGTLEDEKKLIVSKDVPAIWRNNEKKTALIRNVKKIKNDIKSLIISTGTIPLSETETIQLSDIQDLITQTENYSRIQDTIGNILSVKKVIVEKSGINSRILKETLHVFDELYEVVFQQPSNLAVYGNTGKRIQSDQSPLSFNRGV